MKHIVNIELVRECSNFDCPCWGKTCTQTGNVRYMNEDTLKKVLSLMEDVDLENNLVLCYGLGESVEHPKLNKMLSMVKEAKGCKVQINTDPHALINTKSPMRELTSQIDRLVVGYKLNSGFLSKEVVTSIQSETLVHVFILPSVGKDNLQEIDAYIGETINLREGQTYRIAPMWSAPFEEGLPENRGLFNVEDDLDIEVWNPIMGFRAEEFPRLYFTYEGEIKRCFFDDTVYSSIEETHDKSPCLACTIRRPIYVIET